MPRICSLTALLLSLAPAAALAQADSTWPQHNRAAEAATVRGDFGDARHHLLAMDELLGGHPAVTLALARNAVRAGDTTEALARLRLLARMGVVSAGIRDTAFDALRPSPTFQRIAAAIAANASYVGTAQVVATLDDSSAITEDLAWDPGRERWLLSDVRGHRIVALGRDSIGQPFGLPLPPGWAVLGLAADARHDVLWASTVALPQALGYSAADSGKAAILRLDLRTGAVRKRFDLAGSRSAPGDLVVAPNGDLFCGDGQTGAIYVIRQGTDTLEVLVGAGRLRGTQQPAVSPDGRSIFIPDYGRGIARVDRVTGEVRWLHRPDSVTLTGIDGLVWAGGNLIAVQNGVAPNRIVRLALNGAQDSITGARIVLRDTLLAAEPTHAVVVSGRLYAIGNAGWSKYADDGTPLPGVRPLPPRIILVDVPRR